jgi:hypothetical protein
MAKVFKLDFEELNNFEKEEEYGRIIGKLVINNKEYELEITKQRRLVQFYYFKLSFMEMVRYPLDKEDNDFLLSCIENIKN